MKGRNEDQIRATFLDRGLLTDDGSHYVALSGIRCPLWTPRSSATEVITDLGVDSEYASC